MSDRAPFDLDALLAEIAEDELVDREAKRILPHDDIQRLVEANRRRRDAEPPASSS